MSEQVRLMPWLLRLCLLWLLLPEAAVAEPRHAVLYDTGRNDGNFGEMAAAGVEAYEKAGGSAVRERVVWPDENRDLAIDTFIDAGISHIVAVGFSYRDPIDAAAQRYPAARFTIIDSEVVKPNVRSVLFRDDEAGFMVGAAAAYFSRARKIGFLGAMPIPPIHRFRCGYIQGARQIDPTVPVFSAFLGETVSSFRDARGARREALSLLGRGIDVLFTAAGAAGTSALKTVAEHDAYGIGVDRNQNGLVPGRILTSAVKRIDVAIHQALLQVDLGDWQPGTLRLGLAEKGVDWAVDGYNQDLLGPYKDALRALADEVIAGGLTVVPVADEPACGQP